MSANMKILFGLLGLCAIIHYVQALSADDCLNVCERVCYDTMTELGHSDLSQNCAMKCDEQCERLTTQAVDTLTLHEKCPFKWFFSVQESASILFAMLNALAHWNMLWEFLQQQKSDNSAYVSWPTFGAIYALINGLSLATLYHVEDLRTTQMFNYSCGFSIILSYFCCAILRLSVWVSKLVDVKVDLATTKSFTEYVLSVAFKCCFYCYEMVKNKIAAEMKSITVTQSSNEEITHILGIEEIEEKQKCLSCGVLNEPNVSKCACQETENLVSEVEKSQSDSVEMSNTVNSPAENDITKPSNVFLFGTTNDTPKESKDKELAKSPKRAFSFDTKTTDIDSAMKLQMAAFTFSSNSTNSAAPAEPISFASNTTTFASKVPRSTFSFGSKATSSTIATSTTPFSFGTDSATPALFTGPTPKVNNFGQSLPASAEDESVTAVTTTTDPMKTTEATAETNDENGNEKTNMKESSDDAATQPLPGIKKIPSFTFTPSTTPFSFTQQASQSSVPFQFDAGSVQADNRFAKIPRENASKHRPVKKAARSANP